MRNDYSTRWMIASFLRLLRLLAFFMAIFYRQLTLRLFRPITGLFRSIYC
ncbi:spore germination protein [Anoxybacillus kestanbolensis]|nr:spore germination protein [Anoxybacillus kestanbolensis]